MTDINLLPLPDWMECLGEVSAEDIRDYARDNVARATALLRAENEALRAGVGETKEVAVRAMRQRDAQYNRAERLAEALREAYGQVRELCTCYCHAYPEESFARYEALLREQEDEHEQ